MLVSVDRSVPKQENEKPTCSVCLEDLVPPIKPSDEKIRALACGHVFHHPCIDPWDKSNNNCPICRRVIDITRGNVQEKHDGNPVVDLVMGVACLVIFFFSVGELVILHSEKNHDIKAAVLPIIGLHVGLMFLPKYLPRCWRETFR